MLAIQIDDPELEEFYREEYEEYKGDTPSLAQQFMAFLREQRIKRDVKQSMEEIERGEFLTADEVFDQILSRYASN
jgi:hypothetical protein